MKWTWHYITANLKLYKKNVPFPIKISEKNEVRAIKSYMDITENCKWVFFLYL